MARAETVIVFTETARRILVGQGLGDTTPIGVIPHGAPVEMYAQHDRAQVQKSLGIAAETASGSSRSPGWLA